MSNLSRKQKRAAKKAAKVRKDRRQKTSLWAVMDKKDKLWMGTDRGANVYADKKLARISARVIALRLGWSPHLVVVRPYNRPATRIRDELQTLMSGEEAVRQLEERLVI